MASMEYKGREKIARSEIAVQSGFPNAGLFVMLRRLCLKIVLFSLLLNKLANSY